MSGAPDEFRLIADLFAPLARSYPGAFGLTDDAAVLSPPAGQDVVVTVDSIVAGVHFLPDDPPGLVARKLVRVNLSDLAAKGATPFAVLLAAAFPRDVTQPWLEAFATGLGEDLDHFGIALIGGDTVSTPGPLTLSMTAFGHVARGGTILRSGARAGDRIWLTGTIGDGALGLLAARGELGRLDGPDVAFLADRYRLPRPRVAVGPRLVGLAHAGMDVSDGLVQDLGHLCRASGVGAIVETARLPLSEAGAAAVASDQRRIAAILTGGDDYELLFTAPPAAAQTLAEIAAATGVPLTAVGEVVEGAGVTVIGPEGARLAVGQGGWRHFSANGSGTAS